MDLEGRTTGRRRTSRWRARSAALLATAAAATAAALVAAGPASAQGSGDLDRVTVSGIDLAEPLEILAEERPELCAALFREVSWLVGRDPDAPEPEDPGTLGPQYALVVHVDGEPRHRFHLYPLAEGGPRAFRPAEQPGDRTAADGWFYGRLSMPETLGSAGVPLTGDPAGSDGGGGGSVPSPEASGEPDRSVLGFLDEWREGMLLTTAAVVVVVVGLGGVAYLIRRKV